MAALTTLMTRFCGARTVGWLVAALHRILARQMSVTITASYGATDTSVGTTATTPKTWRSVLDSVDPNPVSGKSRSKETIRYHPIWTAYLNARPKFMAPQIS